MFELESAGFAEQINGRGKRETKEWEETFSLSLGHLDRWYSY